MTEVAPPKFVKSAQAPISVWSSFWVQVALLAVNAVRVFLMQPGTLPRATYITTDIVASPIILLFLLALLRGRNWARILVTVFVAGELVLDVVQLFTGPPPSDLFQYVGLVVRLLAVGLLWLPSSHVYFGAVKAERAEFARVQAESHPSP